MNRHIEIKRVYEPASKADGYRVLVDRVWPRGIRKADLDLDRWAKDLAPSTELRTWFGHDPQRWAEFTRRYRRELAAPAMRKAMRDLLDAARAEPVLTLLFAAKDSVHNQAVVLKAVLDGLAAQRGKRKPPH